MLNLADGQNGNSNEGGREGKEGKRRGSQGGRERTSEEEYKKPMPQKYGGHFKFIFYLLLMKNNFWLVIQFKGYFPHIHIK